MTGFQTFRATLPNTWELIIDETFIANTPLPGFFEVIPPIDFPFVLTEELLIVETISQSARPHWTFAGNLFQRFQVPDLPGAQVEANQEVMRLGGMRLIRADLAIPQYTLFLVPPPWLQDLRVRVWRHIRAADTPLSDQLNELQQQVQRVENLLNS